MDLKIIQVPIGQINPAKYNPRKISDEALAGLKESIKKFGFVEPVVINSKTGNLVGGHQRLKAAENLGFKEVPAVHVELTLAEEKALNISLNNPQISGEYTEGLLPLIQEIKAAGIELEPLRIDALKELNFDDFIERKSAEKAGSSPWERIGEASEGVMFSFGKIQKRISQDIYDAFCEKVDSESLEKWLYASVGS